MSAATKTVGSLAASAPCGSGAVLAANQEPHGRSWPDIAAQSPAASHPSTTMPPNRAPTDLVPGRATPCLPVPPCDRRHCTLHCTLTPREGQTPANRRFSAIPGGLCGRPCRIRRWSGAARSAAARHPRSRRAFTCALCAQVVGPAGFEACSRVVPRCASERQIVPRCATRRSLWRTFGVAAVPGRATPCQVVTRGVAHCIAHSIRPVRSTLRSESPHAPHAVLRRSKLLETHPTT